MAAFVLKSFQQIIADMIATFLANSPVNDINSGSVLATFLEAAASEDFNQYYQMLAIISNFALANTTGTDLDNRAIEYGLDGRLQATRATGLITITDTAFKSVATTIYGGLPGPNAGQAVLYISNATGFPNTGTLIIGRGTINVETITYTNIAVGSNYSIVTLGANLANDHGTGETVILSQGGNRTIAAGTIVESPASDLSPSVTFAVNFETILLDGNNVIPNVAVTAVLAGSASNVQSGAINTFDSLPFSTAVVTNPETFINGTDIETDDELRNRIVDHVQSLARGTQQAIITGVIGLVDQVTNKRVVSANLIEGVTVTDVSQLIIDDGTGFEASFSGVGFEEIVPNAQGGETFLQLNLFPVVKALVTTINSQPYPILNNMTLIYAVNGQQETITFTNADFAIPGSGTAQEVVETINAQATLIEARTVNGETGVEINAKSNSNENIQVVGGTANASNILNFSTSIVKTLDLYKFDGVTLQSLNKDGSTAVLINEIAGPYNFSSAHALYLDVRFDGEVFYPGTAGVGSTTNVIVDTGLISVFTAAFEIAGKYVTFLTGVNAGSSDIITDYDPSTGTLTLTSNFVISSNDTYTIDNSVRIYFNPRTGVDFVSPLAATVQEVAAVINRAQKDVASVTNSGANIKLTSKLSDSGDSQIKIYGGNANAVLGFPTAIAQGANKDYTLNRFNGQIELVEPLKAGTLVTAGTHLSRGFLISGHTQPFNLTNGDTISIMVDGGSPQTATFMTASFSNINQATAFEIVKVLNAQIAGITAAVTAQNSISITTNSFSAQYGSIEVTAVTGTAVNIDFPVGVLASSIETHTAYNVSLNTGPYNFVPTDQLVIVLDNNILTETFAVNMSLGGTVSLIQNPNNQFEANLTALNQPFGNKFLGASDLVNFKLNFVTATNSGNVGPIYSITAYNPITSSITISPSTGSPITALDTFDIVPVTTANVVTYLNNTTTSTFSLNGIAQAVDNGTKVQISTLTDGSAGYVEVAGGSANGLVSQFEQAATSNYVYVASSLWATNATASVTDSGVHNPLPVTVLASVPNNPIAGVSRLTLNTILFFSGSVPSIATPVTINATTPGGPPITLPFDGVTSINSEITNWNTANPSNQVMLINTYASFTGIIPGTSTSVTITANNIGTVGNSVALVFSGSNTISQEITTWNTANPGNAVTLTLGNGGQIPTAGTTNLSGGVSSDGTQIPGTAPFFTGIPTGVSTSVTIIAATANGNSVVLTFDGVTSINTAITNWNTANPSNTVSLTSGNGSQIPGTYATFTGQIPGMTTPVTITANVKGLVGNSVTLNFDGTISIDNAMFASYTGTITGTATPVTLTAVTIGSNGNSINLTFDGSTDVNTAITNWNLVNISNQVALTSGNGTQIPSNGANALLSGGTDSALSLWNAANPSNTITLTSGDGTQMPALGGVVTLSNGAGTTISLSGGVGTSMVFTSLLPLYTLANNATISRTELLAFPTTAVEGVDGYKYYTGLLALVQQTIDGIESNPAFPGIKAAGVQIEVLPPIVTQLSFEISLVLAQGITISSVLDDVINAVSTYVNSTKVGQEIILNEIVEGIMAISGIDDMKIISPKANVPVASNGIARVSDSNIIIGLATTS